MAKRVKVYRRGQCVDFVERGTPYTACFTSVSTAKKFKQRRANKRFLESKSIARRLSASDRTLLKKYGLA